MDSCLLALTASTSHKQSCFKIDLGLIKLYNVQFLCLKARVFLVTIMKWHISGQEYKHLAMFSKLVLFKPAASMFVTEGLFMYIYFLLFEENHQHRISRARENISPTISLFSRELIA